MKNYYNHKLSAERLRQAYEMAPPRIRQYLNAEIDYVLNKLVSDDTVLELGCGYGRVLAELSRVKIRLVGIDTSFDSLLAAKNYCPSKSVYLAGMDAAALGLRTAVFDKLVCIQNGISAFHFPPEKLLAECLRVTRPGGRVFISTYSEKIWRDRLEWFKLQSDAGLIGEIDWKQTTDGIIYCKDGFHAKTFTRGQFKSLAENMELSFTLTEIDNSSLFLEIRK